jgi:eukaryotic-like serine/threonine-protein kinase
MSTQVVAVTPRMANTHSRQSVDELFHAVLEQPPSERTAFLAAACGDDRALHAELSSLLAADGRASDDALAALPAEMAADWIADRERDLPAGHLLGRYRVLDRIGAGGMGEVYRAEDTSLHRVVAVKLLPLRFLADTDRTRRFEHEARAASGLNHPNIVTIHEIGSSNGLLFIVSEFVEGETLRTTIARGPLPFGTLVDIAIQIGGALAAAHSTGIVHRDIKTDNVMVRPDGIVKVLDFGIAKLAEPSRRALAGSHAATATGTVMGTVCYMSPEQALGEAVDHRSDIFSLGVVLYEMAAGRLPFSGPSDAAIYDAMLHGTPEPATTVNPDLPADLDRIIARTLECERELRYQTASDLASELKRLRRQSAERSIVRRPESMRRGIEARVTRHTGRRALRWAVSAVIGVLAAAAIWSRWPEDRSQRTTPPVRRFVLTLPSIIEPEQAPGATAVISPDGQHIVYVHGPAARRSLYVRDMDRLDDRPLPGTELGHMPFFSPDSQWVAFVAAGELRKVRLAGGPPQRISVDVAGQRGASWGPDNHVVIATADGRLQRISADGGTLEPIAAPDGARGELAYRWPEVLPGGRAVTYTVVEGSDGQATGRLHLQAIRLDTKERRPIVAGASYGRYAASGHLLYYRAGGLEAAPFDAATLDVTGPAVSLAEQVVGMAGWSAPDGAANFSISSDGTLIYIPGPTNPIERSVFWVDRSGAEHPLAQPRRALVDPSLSPDGRYLALIVNGSVFVVNLVTQSWLQITPQSGVAMAPVWTPDGKRLVYAKLLGAHTRLFWRSADGAGAEHELWSDPVTNAYPTSFSPDGSMLALMRMAPGSVRWDVWMLRVRPEPPEARPLLATNASERHPEFSPDGRWLVFVSDESGRDEVYVQQFPSAGGKLQISSDGGTEPRWNRNGRAIFYREADRMMEVAVEMHPDVSIGRPRLVFEGAYQDVGAVLDYDVAPDSERFLMLKASETNASYMHLHVVLNWFDELRRRAPGASR